MHSKHRHWLQIYPPMIHLQTWIRTLYWHDWPPVLPSLVTEQGYKIGPVCVWLNRLMNGPEICDRGTGTCYLMACRHELLDSFSQGHVAGASILRYFYVYIRLWQPDFLIRSALRILAVFPNKKCEITLSERNVEKRRNLHIYWSFGVLHCYWM